MATPPAATAGGGVLSFDDVVKIEFDFAVRTVKRAAVKFSTSAMGGRPRVVLDYSHALMMMYSIMWDSRFSSDLWQRWYVF